MTNVILVKALTVMACTLVAAGAAHAGFSISVKPIAKAMPAPAGASALVQVTPVPSATATPAAPAVQLKVGKGESLQTVVKSFLSQFGWTPAWMAGEVLAGDAMTFDGKDHEESLTAFLRHYNLIGERFAAEKGYVIRRNTETAGAK